MGVLALFLPLLGALFLNVGRIHAAELFPGGSGWALQFDGMNDFVTMSADMPRAPRTIEFWAHPMELRDGLGDIVVQYNSAGSIIGQASMNRGRNIFLILYNGGEVWHSVTTINDVHTDDVTLSALDPDDQVLYHYAWVEEETNYTIYINGVRANSYPNDLVADDHAQDIAPLPWLLGARAVYSGGDYVVDDRCFGGIIDEVRWWSVARSQAEIIEYMHKPVPKGAPGLVQQWSFDAGNQLTDGLTYALGGGDHSRAPWWVPSPVQTYGGPIALQVMDLADHAVHLCAVLVPASPGAVVSALLIKRPSIGRLNISTNVLFPLPDVETFEGGARHCATLLYSTDALNDTEAYEEIHFDLVADLADGQDLRTSQILGVRIVANLAPIAGVARAVETNGKDNYVSLGMWNIADDWSMSIWVYPNAVVENTEIVSRHLSDGTNIFLVEYFLGGYYVRIDCTSGCWHEGVETPLTARYTAPHQADDEVVFNTGLTGSQVRARRSKPQHIAVTFNCVTRGGPTTNTRGEVRIYSDGMLIGLSEMPVCVTTPLDALAYGDEDYVPSRPAPWELGAEYDPGTLDEHQANVAVQPSNFFDGIFDELTFWNDTLSAEDVMLSALGQVPRDDAVVVRYTFDEDDRRLCELRRFFTPLLECFEINEETGHAIPQHPFQWTNSLVGGARHVRSPFSRVRGAPIHAVLERGTCAEAVLQASDPNGDKVIMHLRESMDESNGMVQMVNNDTLSFCDRLNTGRRDVEVRFDACDEHGLCASKVSGLGKAIFHVFEPGPQIVKFQGVPSQLGLRIAFDMPTNMPRVQTLAGLERLIELVPPLPLAHGTWETGGQFLWVFPDHGVSASFFSTNASVCVGDEQGGGCPWTPPQMRVRVKPGGLLRDAAESTFVSSALSPPLEDATCQGGTVFFADQLDCLSCPSGHIALSQGSEQVCAPCLEGDYQKGNRCEHCEMGMWSNEIAATACQSCLVEGATSGLATRTPMNCFCPAGTYEKEVMTNGVVDRDHTKCLPCPEGMTCPADSREASYHQGFGVAPMLNEGYMSLAQAPLHVYLCKNDGVCPGGTPGTCGRHRDPHAVACGVCHQGYSEMGSDCSTCDETGYILLPVLALFVIIIALMVLVYMVSQDRITESTTAMGPAIISGLTVTAVQTLAVFDNISIVWGEPIKSFLAILAFASLDISFLRTGCLIGSNPLVKLVFAQLIVPSLAVMLSMILCVKKYCVDRNLHLTSALSNGIGSIYLLLFTTIVLSAAKPFVCYKHPGGEASMNSAPSVLCFDGNGEHNALVSVSFIALLIGILPFVTLVCWGSLRFPYYVSGHYDRGGLKRFNFLYRRFQPWAYYFSSILLLRSLAVCLVPVLIQDEPGIHALLLAIVLLTYAFCESTLQPWRNASANLLDNWISGMLVLLLILGMLTTDVRVDDAVLKIASSLFLSMTIGIFLLVGALAIYNRIRPGKTYQRFVCHHKAGAAAMARHLQMLLSAPRGPGGTEQRCFIDSDHLKNLDSLFDIVRSQLRTLVVLLTKETLRRPWCAGEVTTAYRAKIQCVTIHMPDCDACPLCVDPLNEYVNPPVDDLVAAGITTDDMADAFRWVFGPDVKTVEPNLSLSLGHIMADIAAAVMDLPRLTLCSMRHVERGAVHISSNPSEAEATAAANILLMIINQEAAQVLRRGAFLLCDQPELHIELADPMAVIILLTAGTLTSVTQVSTIIRSSALSRIPVNVGFFSFPTADYYMSTLPPIVTQSRTDVVAGVESMQALFRSISIPLTPAGSITIIRAQCLEIIHRIKSPGFEPVNSNKGGPVSIHSSGQKQLTHELSDRSPVRIVIADYDWNWKCMF